METLGWPSSEDIEAVASPFAEKMLEGCRVKPYSPDTGKAKASEREASEKRSEAVPPAAEAAYRGSELPPPASKEPKEPLPEDELRRRWKERFSPPLVEEAMLDDVVDLLYRLMHFNKTKRCAWDRL